MKYTVDRVEEGVAVLEKDDLSHIKLPLSELPDGTKEGSILSYNGTDYILNEDEEAERRRLLIEKQNILFKRAKKD